MLLFQAVGLRRRELLEQDIAVGREEALEVPVSGFGGVLSPV